MFFQFWKQKAEYKLLHHLKLAKNEPSVKMKGSEEKKKSVYVIREQTRRLEKKKMIFEICLLFIIYHI